MLREKWFKSSARALMLMRPMHEPKVSALDEHQHQRKCTGFESFLEHQDLRMYWPNSYTSVSTFILRLILPIKWLKTNIFNRKQHLVYPRKCQRTHNYSRAWHIYANEPIRTSVDKRQIIHVPGPSSHSLRQNFVGIVRRRYVDKIIHFYSYFLHFTTF